MATVRLTVSLRQHISAQISKLFALRMEESNKRITEEAKKIAQSWYYEESAGLRYLVEKNPQLTPWLTKETTFPVRATSPIVKDKDGHRVSGGETINTMVENATFIHPEWNRYGGGAKLTKGEHYHKLCALLDGHVAIIKERDTLLAEIDKLMNSVSTLARLVEVWPSCLDYCDPMTLERHRHVEPKREKPPVPEVSTALKVGLIKARMMTDAKGGKDEQSAT